MTDGIYLGKAMCMAKTPIVSDTYKNSISQEENVIPLGRSRCGRVFTLKAELLKEHGQEATTHNKKASGLKNV